MINFQFSMQFMLLLLQIKFSGQNFLDYNVGRFGPRVAYPWYVRTVIHIKPLIKSSFKLTTQQQQQQHSSNNNTAATTTQQQQQQQHFPGHFWTGILFLPCRKDWLSLHFLLSLPEVTQKKRAKVRVCVCVCVRVCVRERER